MRGFLLSKKGWVQGWVLHVLLPNEEVRLSERTLIKISVFFPVFKRIISLANISFQDKLIHMILKYCWYVRPLFLHKVESLCRLLKPFFFFSLLLDGHVIPLVCKHSYSKRDYPVNSPVLQIFLDWFDCADWAGTCWKYKGFFTEYFFLRRHG